MNTYSSVGCLSHPKYKPKSTIFLAMPNSEIGSLTCERECTKIIGSLFEQDFALNVLENMQQLPTSVKGEQSPRFSSVLFTLRTEGLLYGNPINSSPSYRSFANLKPIFPQLFTAAMLWYAEASKVTFSFVFIELNCAKANVSLCIQAITFEQLCFPVSGSQLNTSSDTLSYFMDLGPSLVITQVFSEKQKDDQKV